MILSAGLTPAWQQILVFDSFRYGEVNRAEEVLWCASGKVFNAGIAAHHLGGPSLTLATVGGPPCRRSRPNSSAGRALSLGPDPRGHAGLHHDPGPATGSVTELVENGRPLDPGRTRRVPPGLRRRSRPGRRRRADRLPAARHPGLLPRAAERTPCPAVLDFRGPGLLSVLDLEPLVVKPNREELAQTVGQPLDSDEELLTAMRTLNDRGARWVVITQGPAGLGQFADASIGFHPPAIPDAVNPIASGDALAATIAWATRDGRPLPEAVRLGLAAAAQNVRQLLPCRLDPRRWKRRPRRYGSSGSAENRQGAVLGCDR